MVLVSKKPLKKKNHPHWKVHITYNSREHHRITDPIIRQRPDAVYYMFFDDGKRLDINLTHKQDNIKYIKEKLPNCELHEIGVNYLDYYELIANLAQIFSNEKKSHPDHEVIFKINLGTGSKMVAIANMDAHRLWENTQIIYPYSDDYNPAAEAMHQGTIKVAKPPKFEFKHPKTHLIQSIQILYKLKQMPDKFGHIQDFVELRELFHYVYEIYKIMKVKRNEEPRKENSSQYMQLSRSIVDKLEKNWGFIKVKKVGKHKHLYFTEKGLKIAQVFVNYDYGIDLAKIHR